METQELTVNYDEMMAECMEIGKSGTDVYGFQGPTRFLSNFWPCHVSYRGRDFKSVENAYQASKDFDNEAYVDFVSDATPGRAKQAAKAINNKMSRTWRNMVGLRVMRWLVVQKFSRNEELDLLLVATRNVDLIEANSWGDVFWGVDAETGDGGNHLGLILMDVRTMVREVYRARVGKMTPVVVDDDPIAQCPMCCGATGDHPRVSDALVRRCDGFVRWPIVR